MAIANNPIRSTPVSEALTWGSHKGAWDWPRSGFVQGTGTRGGCSLQIQGYDPAPLPQQPAVIIQGEVKTTEQLAL